MPYLFSDTIQDSLSIYLRAAEQPVRDDSFVFGEFEYLPVDSQRVFFVSDPIVYESFVPLYGNEGLMFSFSPVISGVLFLMFLSCFIIFAFVFNKEGAAYISNFRDIFSLRKRSYKSSKEQVTTTEIWGEVFMTLQAILMYTIFIVFFLQDNGFSSLLQYSFASFFLGAYLALLLMAGLKYLMYRAIAVFFLKNDIRDWIIRYFRLIQLSGIVLFLPVLVYVFLPEIRPILAILILVLFFVIRIVVFLELLNIFVKNKIGGFYFFMYLCGTEVAPYLLYYKGVLSIVSFVGNIIV